MARRRVQVVDVVEVLVQWQAKRSVKQIVRSTGMARNTVRRYMARVSAAGLRRDQALPRAELQALVEKACPELVSRPSTTGHAEQLRGVREEIVSGLKESPMATVWQRLRDAGQVSCSVITFRRFVRREVREVDPDKLAVRRPPARLGDAAEVDFGVLGMWLNPLTQQQRRLWAFVALSRNPRRPSSPRALLWQYRPATAMFRSRFRLTLQPTWLATSVEIAIRSHPIDLIRG